MSRFSHALEDVRIASPCKASWDDMTGDDRVRFCGACEKNVYNLTALTRAAAEQLLAETEGKICVRFWQRGDGTVLTQDCPEGKAIVSEERRRHLLRFGGFGAMLAGAALVPAVLRVSTASGPTCRLPVLQGEIVETKGERSVNTLTMGDPMPPHPLMGTPPPPVPEPVKMGKPAAAHRLGGAAWPRD